MGWDVVYLYHRGFHWGGLGECESALDIDVDTSIRVIY